MSPLHKSRKSSKFNRKRHFDREKYRCKGSHSPTRYDRPKFIGTRDFPRRCDTVYPLGSPPQTWENSMNGPGPEIISPNCDRSRNYDTVSSQFQNPILDISRRCDAVLSRVHNPRYDVVSPLYQNPTRDYYSRKSEADSLRFQERRSEVLDKTEMNPTCNFSRKSDSGTPRSQVRTSENPKGTYLKSTPRRELSRKYGSVSPRFQTSFCFKPEDKSFAKVKSTHGLSRKFEDISCKETKEKSREDSMVKMSPTRKRKFYADSPRVEVRNSRKFKDDKADKMNPSYDSSRECADFPPQVQVNTSVVPYKAKLFEGSVTRVANSEPIKATVPWDDFKVQKVDTFCVFPKHCRVNSKEDPILKKNPNRKFTKICDVGSPRVGAKTNENSKEDLVEKVDQSCNYSTNCLAVSPQIQATSKILKDTKSLEVLVTNDENYGHTSEILKEGKPSEVLVANDQNYEPTNAELPYNNFKIRKVNAIRKFPKHCGAFAPRVTVSRIDENLVVIEEASPKLKVVNDSIKGIEPRFEVSDLEEVVNVVKADDVEKVLSQPILAKDLDKVVNEAVLVNDMDNVLNEAILTNAPVNLELPKSVASFDVLKDHSLDHKDDMAPLEEQSLLGADKSLDCEGQENRNGKCKSPVYRSGLELSLFEKHQEETCSEDEGNSVHTPYLNNSDLLPNEDKIKAVSIVDCETVLKQKQVKETIESYGCILAKLLEDNKAAVSSGKEKVYRQAHIEAAMLLKREQKWVNTEQILGHVPGIEVGDKFHFRAELVCIGLHRMFYRGIDYMRTREGKFLATSIVDSGRYANDAESCDVLVYCGEGGNPTLTRDKQPQDQKLERGNLALKNSMEAKTPVRVIRKATEICLTYYYDGIYVVTKVTQERSQYGKLVYMFQLNRIISGEPNITQVEKLSILVEDISQGKEKIPICVVNTIDDEQVPMFNYITNMTYPNSCYCDIFGCDCTDCYSDSKKCLCFTKNGGEIIFSDNGAIIVKAKSKRFIYECGPSCKCPSSCKNRVSQYGIQYQLEIFKTKSMGWGVRSRNYIPAGSFICEYVGELLQDGEAEQRIGNDEYLFQIDNDGFTIDGAKYGNVGRFINHSCSPNLYAQNVLYDHGNKRMPHVMFFAVNGIFPFQELTYDYNYKLDKVLDSNGNIKRKACRCGSRGCTGRLY